MFLQHGTEKLSRSLDIRVLNSDQTSSPIQTENCWNSVELGFIRMICMGTGDFEFFPLYYFNKETKSYSWIKMKSLKVRIWNLEAKIYHENNSILQKIFEPFRTSLTSAEPMPKSPITRPSLDADWPRTFWIRVL